MSAQQEEAEPEQIHLTPEEAQALQARIEGSSLEPRDIKIMVGLISFSLWLQKKLELMQLSLDRLRRLFGLKSKTEKKTSKKGEDSHGSNDKASDDLSDSSTTEEAIQGTPDSTPADSSKKKSAVFDPQANHGRLSANDYTGCPLVVINHSELKAGDACPACLAAKQSGKLKAIAPRVLVLLESKPLIHGTRYQYDCLRCGLCDQVYTASLPDDIKEAPKYDASCSAMLAIARYHLGVPMKRIERLQRYCGVPLPDATQWDQLQALYQCIEPVYRELERCAAQGQLIQYDDTPNRILSQIKAYEQGSTPRKGVYTTVLVSHHESHRICLFYTGVCYGGENFNHLLKQRTETTSLITMTDAHKHNMPDEIAEWLYARWIIAFCLVHGRRHFVEIEKSFPAETAFVIDQIALVYQHDRQCQGMTAEARLAYHQQHSGPVMAQLHSWLTNQWHYQQLEETSGLGKAVRYMLKHWTALTRFLTVPGIPLDNNLVERIVKVAIRHRKNSLFYKTTRGAQVGDGLMSLIETAIQNKINPLLYLVTLQQEREAVIASPRDWLPWCYQPQFCDSKAA